jgi:NIPSNAP protein
MDRRAFVSALGGAGLLAAPDTPRKTRLYRLTYFYMRMGDQPARLNQFFASQLPLIRKTHPGPLGVFNVFLGSHLPAMVTLAGFAGFAEMDATLAKWHSDPGFQKALAELESGPEPPNDRVDVTLLEATDYSPEIQLLREKPKTSRIFELRVYHSPTLRQNRLLHERFAGPEIRIFHRVGVHPVLYTTTLIGPNMPNLTYLTPFATLAEREKAWDAFGADPEWVKVRKESVDRGGQITNQISITLLRPTDYSPIQ